MKPATRAKIFERDSQRCVACSSSQDLTIQHRVSRGMGGSKLYDRPAFLITMCWKCNTMLESDSARAEEGRANGWKISRNTNPPTDPTEIPVKIASRWYLLDNEFNRKEIKNAK